MVSRAQQYVLFRMFSACDERGLLYHGSEFPNRFKLDQHMLTHVSCPVEACGEIYGVQCNVMKSKVKHAHSVGGRVSS